MNPIVAELQRSGLRAQIQRTRDTVTSHALRSQAAHPGVEAFAECDCGECITIGRHFIEWVSPEVQQTLVELGLDPHLPIEAVTYGTLGAEDVVIEIHYVGVGTLDSKPIRIDRHPIRVDAGNHAPCSFDALEMPSDIDESQIYTLTIRLYVSKALTLLPEPRS